MWHRTFPSFSGLYPLMAPKLWQLDHFQTLSHVLKQGKAFSQVAKHWFAITFFISVGKISWTVMRQGGHRRRECWVAMWLFSNSRGKNMIWWWRAETLSSTGAEDGVGCRKVLNTFEHLGNILNIEPALKKWYISHVSQISQKRNASPPFFWYS